MTREQHIAAQAEWRTWQDVCKQLKALGAVTEQDLASSPRKQNTPGQILLGTIRKWGEELAEIRVIAKT